MDHLHSDIERIHLELNSARRELDREYRAFLKNKNTKKIEESTTASPISSSNQEHYLPREKNVNDTNEKGADKDPIEKKRGIRTFVNEVWKAVFHGKKWY